jgi:hypothetical protein
MELSHLSRSHRLHGRNVYECKQEHVFVPQTRLLETEGPEDRGKSMIRFCWMWEFTSNREKFLDVSEPNRA